MTNVEQFRKVAQELSELYEKKNVAYGNSFADTYKKLGLISAVTRISDKFNRLCNLATNPDIDNLGESLEDTLRDMASYCIMTVMEIAPKNSTIKEPFIVGQRVVNRKERYVADIVAFNFIDGKSSYTLMSDHVVEPFETSGEDLELCPDDVCWGYFKHHKRYKNGQN